ncbi:MAG TPA: ABC transporter ATP-binding protein, partial [Spirochaetota bacterium]|nr:ABC transporter ATP-binding protein [Spirochaetota bacterium]
GVTGLVGQNGVGKSTFMLLCGGLLLPQSGDIYINGINSRDVYSDELTRRELVSFIYQNMEFETEENISALLKEVYNNGFLAGKNVSENIIDEVIDVCELEKILDRKTQEISKGELQRTIVAFSILYGTQIIMMDEPVFACEDYIKNKMFDYLIGYSKKYNISILYSAHELELTEKYSEYVIFFYKKSNPIIGKTSELFGKKNIEEVFDAPYSVLKKREQFYREGLLL